MSDGPAAHRLTATRDEAVSVARRPWRRTGNTASPRRPRQSAPEALGRRRVHVSGCDVAAGHPVTTQPRRPSSVTRMAVGHSDGDAIRVFPRMNRFKLSFERENLRGASVRQPYSMAAQATGRLTHTIVGGGDGRPFKPAPLRERRALPGSRAAGDAAAVRLIRRAVPTAARPIQAAQATASLATSVALQAVGCDWRPAAAGSCRAMLPTQHDIPPLPPTHAHTYQPPPAHYAARRP